MKASIRCNCGQKIASRDVMQQGYYIRHFGPSYVYLKFRCSRCKKVGEHFVKQEEWSDELLASNHLEFVPGEKSRFEQLGRITVEELVDFHHALDQLEYLPADLQPREI